MSMPLLSLSVDDARFQNQGNTNQFPAKFSGTFDFLF
jgi:hypothetical protein